MAVQSGACSGELSSNFISNECDCGYFNSTLAWNDFLLPLVVLSDQGDRTLPLVQYVFQSQFATNYNLAFASYLMALLPMLVVYLFLQKRIISGVTQGAIKS